MAERRPNILLLVTDHQLHYRHGWDGGQGPLTPFRDAFARQGRTFHRAYAVTPLCGPARRSLVCGEYPHTHRNFHNQSETDFTKPTYLQLLDQAGYTTYAFGKWHAGPKNAVLMGAKGFSPSGYGNPYTSEAYAAYCKELGIAEASHTIDTKFWNADTARHFPDLYEGNTDYRCRGSWCGETAFGTTNTDKRSHECFFLAHLAQEALKTQAKQAEQPFHMRIDFWGPHQPYFPTQEFIDRYNPSDILEYGSFRDNLENKPFIYRRMNQPIADESGELLRPSIFSWERWQHLLAIAYAQTTMIDEAIGTILATLEEVGLADDTLVIWTSDHGDALASHGGMFDKGSFMTEETVRIPLLLRWPNRIVAGSHSQQLVNTLDIMPTILEAAGLQKDDELFGSSLLGLPQETQRSCILLESYGQGFRDTKRSRTLVTQRYKYTRNEDDMDELYDLELDPYELCNRSGDASLKQGLSDLLYAQLVATNDPQRSLFYPERR
ncbi:MAG: sulfatase-like hydrolase/transferase [Sphaerochaeta sp.]|uniref:sulfatase-like hydrolase/transferase n=1 Tax=Sphaerochaeta sp. TaxID=1972642 RepID=UPI003D0D8549